MKSWFQQLKLSQKLIVFFGSLIIIASAAIAGFSFYVAKESVKNEVLVSLEHVVDYKRKSIEKHFLTIEKNIKTLTADSRLRKGVEDIVAASGNDSLQGAIKNEMNASLRDEIRLRGMKDVHIVDMQHRLIYSTDDNSEFLGHNEALVNMFNKEKTVFGKVVNCPKYQIFKIPITAHAQFGNTEGYIMAEIDLEDIFAEIKDTVGLGKTGETLIAQRELEGALFINQLRHKPDAALKLKAEFGNPAAKPILEAVQGNKGADVSRDYRNVEVIAAWEPIEMLDWGLVAKIDTEEAYAAVSEMQIYIFAIACAFIALVVILTIVFTNVITRPITSVKNVFVKLAKGELPDQCMERVTNDEIGDMITAANQLLTYQKEIVKFAQNVETGDFDAANEIDVTEGELIEAMVSMAGGLQSAAQVEERRNWVMSGLASFSDILRSNSSKIEDLSFEVITQLVKYIGVNQGMLFVLNDENEDKPHLEVTGAYAFDRQKFMEKKIKKGEGLVGECWAEGLPVRLSEMPSGYIEITSGLGDAEPQFIYITPLKLEEEIFGVIELASFNDFEDHQIELIDKLAESIASTLKGLKVNQQTGRLLEESKRMQQEMMAQEEEMRQNMEEMQATQESMKASEDVYRKEIQDLKTEISKLQS